MNQRGTAIVSFSLAVVLHALLFLVASRHYQAASTNPERTNAAARALAGARDRPIQFIYVKDTVPSKEPPLDRSRLSDIQRRGSSPDGGKGTSPDPTSRGDGSTRTAARGLPMPAPPATGGSQARPSPPRKGSRGSPAVSPRSGGGSTSSPASNADASAKPGVGLEGMKDPAPAKGGTPQPGSQGSPAVPPSPGSAGLGRPIQQMYLGSIKGGYNNPIASKLNSGTVSFDTAGWDLGPYARQVQERVESNWRLPEAQSVLRQKGWVSIHFNVQKNGAITDLEVIRSSGIPSYDQSALNAMLSSNPLPPLPREVTLPKISGTFRFFFNMPIDDNAE